MHTGGPSGMGSEAKAWLLHDEVDMWAGPGDTHWNGTETYPVCIPTFATCGYTVMQTLANRAPADGRLRYAN